MPQDVPSSGFFQRCTGVRQRVDFDLTHVQRGFDIFQHGERGAAVRQRRVDIEQEREFIGEDERREDRTTIVDDATRVQQRGRIENVEKVITSDTLKDWN